MLISKTRGVALIPILRRFSIKGKRTRVKVFPFAEFIIISNSKGSPVLVSHIFSLIKSYKKTSDIKSLMQLNSYIVFDEIAKGLSDNKNKKAIKFNIDKQLSIVQEELDSKMNIEEILNNKISA